MDFNLLFLKFGTALILTLICATRVSILGHDITGALHDEPNCYVVINELNTDSPTPGPKKQQFIELQQLCDGDFKAKSRRLQGYKLVVVQGYPLTVTMVVNLHNENLTPVGSNERFYVIGGTDINVPWKLPFSSDKVQSVYQNNILPVGDDSLFAVALVYSNKILDLRALQLEIDPATRKYIQLELKPVGVTPIAYNTIKFYLVNMLVWGRKSMTNRCKIFDNLWPNKGGKYAGNSYILRDFDELNYPDLSINRCSSNILPFNYQDFKLAKPSPGTTNLCETGARFFLEDNINSISPRLPQTADTVIPLLNCEPDDSIVTLDRYRDIDGASYTKKVRSTIAEATGHCHIPGDSYLGTVDDEMNVIVDLQLIERNDGGPLSPPFKKHIFNQDWVSRCSDFLPQGGLLLHDPGVQTWLDIEVSASPNECRFSCATCKRFFEDGYRADIKRKSDITTQKGYFSPYPSHNRQNIMNHEISDLHKDATKLFCDLNSAATHEKYLEVKKNQEEAEYKLYLPTINLVRFVYAEVLANVPFNNQPFFMSVLQTYDVNVEIHHKTRAAANDITNIIAKSFHKTIITYLVNSNMPFSIMCDSSTDRQNIPYLIIYIQSLEDSYPIVYLYGLLPLDKGESSKEMIARFKRRIESDNQKVPGFENYIKSNLRVFSSDGCSSMIGIKQSFKTELTDYLGRPIASVWCMAHRVNLAVQRSILKNTDPNFRYFHHFEKINNMFYGFYFSRGSKRFQHLADIASEIKVPVKRLKYKFEIRWSSSHRRAVKALDADYDLLRVDLTAIVTNGTEFTDDAKHKAEELHLILEDKTFPIVLREYIDFLGVYETMSLQLQQTQGLLVEKKTDPNSINFSLVRSKLYESLVDGINFYFNIDLLYSFEIFNPKRLTRPQCMNLDSPYLLSETIWNFQYTKIKINKTLTNLNADLQWETVCNFYFEGPSSAKKQELASCLQSRDSWNTIIRAIRENINYQNNMESQASRFWPYVLQDASIPWTDMTKKVVTYVLITPFGTADAERGFSYLNNVKSHERILLSPDSVENIIRIKVNGPKKIETFDAFRYAREYIKYHGRSDDTSLGGGRPLNPLIDQSFFRDSRLF